MIIHYGWLRKETEMATKQYPREEIDEIDSERKRNRTEWTLVSNSYDPNVITKRLEVPGGWIYLVNGITPIFVPCEDVDDCDYPEDYE